MPVINGEMFKRDKNVFTYVTFNIKVNKGTGKSNYSPNCIFMFIFVTLFITREVVN